MRQRNIRSRLIFPAALYVGLPGTCFVCCRNKHNLLYYTLTRAASGGYAVAFVGGKKRSIKIFLKCNVGHLSSKRMPIFLNYTTTAL
jgi:hypothetical protein